MTFDETIPNMPGTWANNRLHFFKYMSESTAKKVLENRTLRWSTAATLNDPFEMQLQVSADGIDFSKVKQGSLEKIWNLYSGSDPISARNQLGIALETLRIRTPGLPKEYIFDVFGQGFDEGISVLHAKLPKNRKEILAELSPIKILSLTSSPDIGLMWSHYANSHKGIVIRFRSIPEIDGMFGMAKPIFYSDIRPSLLTEDYLINSFSGQDSTNTREITNSIIYTKMNYWSYEKEWRISLGNGRNKDAPFEDLPFGINEIDGIIFGPRTSGTDRVEIRKLAHLYPSIEFMEARPDQAAGKVEIVLI
ncbi:DUF2971 domain-containing protein [Mesorhizobium sp. RCC_202]|uniref:DUF2971 domain-containing protein n=1 Tax=Mesorhizobium sp. RCC_202 TaxID=3239222 RepID=UPI0035244FBF